MCDLIKPGQNAGGRPRGQRFKDIASDLLAITKGESLASSSIAPAAASQTPTLPEPKVNLPLAESTNERARSLTNLDRKFTVNLADMPPVVSSYFRRRPFLTAEICQQWRMGYLPRDAGEDKSGGTMRGKMVYPYFSEKGELLSWFGRDPSFEEKHREWEASEKGEREPEKFHFVKGFHRGLELFGQHLLRDTQAAERIKALGFLPLVEGPNDVIRLSTLDVPAVGLCSNTITRDQAAKAARLARELCNGIVAIFLDCDPEGLNGMKQCLGYLAQITPVRLVWTDKMFGGKFKGRQPESLTANDWQEIEAFLKTGKTEDWTLN